MKDTVKQADKKKLGNETGRIVVLLHKKENARMYTTCNKEEGTKDKYI
jgi:hypothetical protein